MAHSIGNGMMMDDFGNIYPASEQVPWDESIDGPNPDTKTAQQKYDDLMKGKNVENARTDQAGSVIERSGPLSWVSDRISDIAFVLLGIILIVVALVITPQGKAVASKAVNPAK